MKIEYYKEYSPSLGREMEFQAYGHGGKPCIVFPTQNGRFFDWGDRHMPDLAAPWIDSGRLQLFCVDSVDAETISDETGDKAARAALHERWYNYIMEELVPRIYQLNGGRQKLTTTGCSVGAGHAGNFALRRPDVFDGCIALSGVYEMGVFFGDYDNDILYRNSPVQFIQGMAPDHPYIHQYNQNHLIFCVGQGDWEEILLESTRRLEAACKAKGIHAWFDYWGFDVAHDWPWWEKQWTYFLGHLLG